jgi:glycerate 2-kinase
MLVAVPHLVAAPDKFRGTATAPEVAGAAARAATSLGWTADEVPMADGGEGTLDAVGGEVRHTTVSGPLGRPVVAEWRMRPAADGAPGSTAVVEMAQAAGRALLPRPSGDDAVVASTAGVGELVLAAVDAGARRVVVAVGGSATTDGGWGAVQVIGTRQRLGPTELVVACDVRTPFRRAAEVFGPQKGASPAQVAELGARLDTLADRYRRDLGVDMDTLPGAGAAGGLAGGLAALGARLVPGFELVADLVDLGRRLATADVVVTGEGHLDPPSFDGKVVGGVLSAVGGRVPVLCVVGDVDPSAAARLPHGAPVEVVSLTRLAGTARARREVVPLVAEVVTGYLARYGA